LIEDFSCKRSEELHARERYWIENTECVNKNIPTRTDKEYYQDNKEIYFKKYYEEHKEKIKQYREEHKEKRKECKKQYNLKKKKTLVNIINNIILKIKKKLNFFKM